MACICTRCTMRKLYGFTGPNKYIRAELGVIDCSLMPKRKKKKQKITELGDSK